MVARADIARVAAAVLAHPAAHVATTYDLTGREALALGEVAGILTETTGMPTTYHDESIEETFASRARYGAPAWQVDAWVSTYTAIAAGDLAEVNDNVERLTGQPPVTLREHLAATAR